MTCKFFFNLTILFSHLIIFIHLIIIIGAKIFILSLKWSYCIISLLFIFLFLEMLSNHENILFCDHIVYFSKWVLNSQILICLFVMNRLSNQFCYKILLAYSIFSFFITLFFIHIIVLKPFSKHSSNSIPTFGWDIETLSSSFLKDSYDLFSLLKFQ